jgi:hypothetical protein
MVEYSARLERVLSQIMAEVKPGQVPEEPGPCPPVDDIEACAEWFHKKVTFDFCKLLDSLNSLNYK